ncbi:sulfurtransferase FdhD, partial [Mesorhizobium sp. M00.F.Ca.ET.186.01.1.1]
MIQPVFVLSPVLRYENGSMQEKEDSIVTESPITIVLNDEEFATLVCSPEYIEELVIGFLASEGVIQSYQDITDLFIDEPTGFAYVRAKNVNTYNQMFHSKRYVTSCCGKSRQSFYFYNDARTVRKRDDTAVTIPAADCFRFMQ